jgi:hypothetical protein
MQRVFALAVFGAVIVAVLVFSGEAPAGQFKRIIGGGLTDGGGFVFAHASPRNFGNAMEMDVYEFETPASDSYRCGILNNNTGRSLNVRLVGVNGTIINSCATPVNGTCATPFVGLFGGLLFQCTVSTGFGSPVTDPAYYRFFVQRQ